MRRYGDVAIQAVDLILSTNMNPKQAWDIETRKLINSESTLKRLRY